MGGFVDQAELWGLVAVAHAQRRGRSLQSRCLFSLQDEVIGYGVVSLAYRYGTPRAADARAPLTISRSQIP